MKIEFEMTEEEFLEKFGSIRFLLGYEDIENVDHDIIKSAQTKLSSLISAEDLEYGYELENVRFVKTPYGMVAEGSFGSSTDWDMPIFEKAIFIDTF